MSASNWDNPGFLYDDFVATRAGELVDAGVAQGKAWRDARSEADHKTSDEMRSHLREKMGPAPSDEAKS